MEIIEQKDHLYKLDVVRGFACLLVFLFHTIGVKVGWGYEINNYDNYLLSTHSYSNERIFWNFFPLSFGWAGVQLFLVISGFLIHLAFLNQKNENLNIKLYLNKRFWRIYPPYFVALLFFSFFSNSSWVLSWNGMKQFFYHVFFIQNIDSDTFFGINGVFWSLALEFQLYLLYPLFLLIRKKVKVKKVFMILLALSLAISLAGFVFNIKGIVFDSMVLKSWYTWAAGALIAEAYVNKEKIFSINNSLFVLLILLFFSVKFFSFFPYFSKLIASFIAIIGVEKYISKATLDKNIFESFLLNLGLCSYGFYLFHLPFLADLYEHISIFGLSRKFSIFFPLDIIAVFTIIYFFSYGFYRFVELSSITLGKKIYFRFLK
jgi:peptidoglycan/LPS O-acetylase OafA/YrhL